MYKPGRLFRRNRATYTSYQWRNLGLIFFKRKYDIRCLVIKDKVNRLCVTGIQLLELTDKFSIFNFMSERKRLAPKRYSPITISINTYYRRDSATLIDNFHFFIVIKCQPFTINRPVIVTIIHFSTYLWRIHYGISPP